jgi:hypothetical protein
MWWQENIRRLAKLSPWTALLMAIACGGGDKSPTGPGGGGASQLRLVALGRVGLPADAQLEDCLVTRFYGGSIRLDPASDRWQLTLQAHDDNYGDFTSTDEGWTETDGAATRFDSDVSGSSYQGTIDGSGVTIMYDWCYNGVPDVQLVFGR